MRITSLLLSPGTPPCAGARFLLGVAEECPDLGGELRVVLERERVRHGGMGFRFG